MPRKRLKCNGAHARHSNNGKCNKKIENTLNAVNKDISGDDADLAVEFCK